MADRVETEAKVQNGFERHASKARFEAGELIGGRYRVISAWGSGRLDEAYQVEDLQSRKRVVLRVLRRTREQVRPSRGLTRLFTRLSRLSHENVARFYDLAVHVVPDSEEGDESVLFVTSELVEGETLGSYIRKARPLSPREAFSLIDGICSGLAAAHKRRIVHGNLSSAAIMLCTDGSSTRVVITDFTFSASDDHPPVASIVSPVYKAPETIVGRPPDQLSDVFSLGAIAYEILSGRIPFTGGNLLALDFRRLEEEPRPLRELVENVDPRLERAITRCLSRAPDDRYANAEEVRQAISGAEYWTPRTRRNVSTLSAAAALVAVMLGGSALLDRVSVLERERLALLGAAGYRPSFALLDLEPEAGDSDPWAAMALSQLIRNDLSESGSIRVADDALVRELLGREARPVGVPDAVLSTKIRSLFDVEAIVIGTCTIDDAGGVPAVVVDLCVVDAQTGETLAAAFERGLPDSLPELAARASDRLRTSLGIIDRQNTEMRWDPDAVRPWAEGVLLQRRHRARDALEQFERAAALQPGNPQIQDALTLVWSEIGSSPRAVEAARRSVDLSRHDATEQYLERRARLAQLEGNLKKAAEVRSELVRAFPDRLAHSYRLIETLLRAGASQAAEEEIRLLRMARTTVDPRTEILEARLDILLGRFDSARSHAERASQIARSLGIPILDGEALIERARAEASVGRTTTAWSDLLLAEQAMTEASEPSGLTRIDTIRATLLQRQGDLEAAMNVYSRVRERYRIAGQELGAATSVGSQATIRSLQGRHAEAIALLEDAIGIFGELEDSGNLVRSLGLSGGEFHSLGRLAEAREGFAAAATVARERDLPTWEAYSYVGLAKVAIDRLDLDEASRQVKDASSIFKDLALNESTAGVDIVTSEIDRLRGDLEAAKKRLGKDGEDISNRERQAELRHALASVALASGDDSEALRLAAAAASHYATIRNLDREVDCLTIALSAAIRIRDRAAVDSIEARLDQLESQIESPICLLRLQLARSEALEGPEAQAQRSAVFNRSGSLGLPLIELTAAHALHLNATTPRERERWRSEVSKLVRQSGARLFLRPTQP